MKPDDRGVSTNGWAALARTGYYMLKPFIPRCVRYLLRGRLARRTLARARDWPIKLGTERPPDGWSGWPGGRRFAVVLTHDVEGGAGLERCRALCDLEMGCGFRSSFNFVPEGEYQVPGDLRQELVERGFEVGVHDLHHDGSLYRNRAGFLAQATRINQYLKAWGAVGFRAGFMLHNLRWLQDLEIEYDASTFDVDPFEPQPDGVDTIFPFWVEGGEAGGGYVELPYTLVQDSTLFLFLRERGIEPWKRKVDWVAQHGGMVLVNTHPDYMDFRGDGSWREYPADLYAELMTYINERHRGTFWQALPRDVARWFRETHVSSPRLRAPARLPAADPEPARVEAFSGRRAAVVLFSDYPGDPRPRRAAEALAQAGAQVEVLCLCDQGQSPGWERIQGVEVCRISLRRRRGGFLRYLFEYCSFLFRAGWFLGVRSLRHRYDLVHVHNMPDFLVFSALVPRLLGARVILDLHDPMPELYQTLGDLACDHWISRVLRRVEKASIAFAHLAITPNQAFREVFVGRSCSPDKMHVVMNSPEEDVFHPGVEQALAELSRPPGDQPFRILFHGSLVHRHGLDTAVEAVVAAMPEVGSVHLYICGWRTPYLDSVLELAQDRGIGDRVHYLGARSLDEIARLIAGVDLGVIPNRRSPFTEINMPTRIFEYLAVGKPVVAPSTRGIRDYFGEDDLIFFNPGDAEDLARQFVRVHHSPDAVARIVARGRAVYERHRWQVNRREFLRLTAALLENRLVASVSLGLSSAETNPLASVPPGQVRS